MFFRSLAGDTREPDRFLHNHVYSNGAMLDGMAMTEKWLAQWKPDILLTGHAPPIEMNELRFASIKDAANEYVTMHRLVMPIGDEDTHFNLDSYAGWLWPYRTHQPGEAEPVALQATVRNPLPTHAAVQLKLIGPDGWRCEAVEFTLGGHQEMSHTLVLHPQGNVRQQPIALEMWVDGQPFGQIAEALVTIGPEYF